MARMNYGQVGTIVSSNVNTSGPPPKQKDKDLQAVRVKSIILDDSEGWENLGKITYEVVKNPGIKGKAYPISSNFKNYPLVNEIVYIIPLPSTRIGDSSDKVRQYYINTINLWNHPHHNAYPLNPNVVAESQRKSNQQIELGSPRVASNQPVEIKLGKTFNEKSSIHPLRPFEGDVIYEGRWGNSIRLGSTVNGASNNWSEVGDNGNPLIVIRNGQGLQTNEGWVPVTEDVNNDNSSIYLTYNQKIPIEATSTDYTSYSDTPPVQPNQFTEEPQIILNSGRLLFNSYADHILLSSAKSINLNSQTSVNVDSKKFIIQADKIFLGKEELATEPLLKGNATVSLLRNLIESLETLSTALKTAQTSPTVPGTPANLFSVNLAAVSLSTSLMALKTQLNTLTSKRNFTI